MAKREYITTETAAKEIGLSIRTIQNWIKSGKIPSYRISRLYLIDRKIWEEWKARNIIAA